MGLGLGFGFGMESGVDLRFEIRSQELRDLGWGPGSGSGRASMCPSGVRK